MRIGFYLDHSTFDDERESTPRIMGFLHEAGHDVLYLGSEELEERVEGPVKMYNRQNKRTEEAKLSTLDGLILRKDPPIDRAKYEEIAGLENQVRMINPASLILRMNKKFMGQEFLRPYTPETIFSRDEEEIRRQVSMWEKAIIKPLDGFAGQGIFPISVREYDPEKVREATQQGQREVVVQRYLNEADKGDKRVIVIGGEIVGGLLRVPREPGALCNFHQGGRLVPTKVTEKEQEAIEDVWPDLREQGMHYGGFDFIGGKLTEINFTSPMLFGPYWKDLYSETVTSPEETFAQYVMQELGR